MNQEQKFDKIIKKKVDEAEFPFDEQNWNKLSIQLDTERRAAAVGRSWGKFLYLGLLFLGITSVSIALYKIQGPFNFKEKLTASISSNNRSDVSSSHYSNNQKETNYENNLLAINNHKESVADYLTGTVNEKSIYSKTNGNSSVLQNDDVITSSNSGSETTSGGSVNSVNSSKEITANSISKSSSSVKDASITNTKNASGLQKNSTSKSNSVNEMALGNRTKTGLSGEVVLEHTVLNRIDASLPIVSSTRNVKTAALKMPSWYDDDYHRKGKKRFSFLNAEIGGAFLLGWDSKNGKDGKGLNWYAGVNYGKFISKKIGFSVGSQFYNIGNIKQPFYESSKSVYGLGSTSSNTVITTQALFYFSVPVKFYYALNSNHQVGASVNSSFLFSSKNAVENFHLTDNVKSNEMKATTSGIYEGVRLNNILVSVFYRAKLNKRLFLNTEVLYGIRDIFKNTTSNDYSQKPIGLRVGLQYTLFEK